MYKDSLKSNYTGSISAAITFPPVPPSNSARTDKFHRRSRVAFQNKLAPVTGKHSSTWPTLLLLPGLITDCRSDCDGRLPAVVVVVVVVPALDLEAPLGADENAEAGLLEDGDVVVVGVAHRPSRSVLLGLLRGRGVDEAAVALGPLLVEVETLGMLRRGFTLNLIRRNFRSLNFLGRRREIRETEYIAQ